MLIRNYRPFLVNLSGRWTQHVYCGSELITLGHVNEIQTTGIAHMYKCVETEQVRRWGFDAPYTMQERDTTRGGNADASS